ncbi:nucleotidyltransferase family protein [Herbaspirillum rhizosphaerae]|uniref:nucleotidyltransferase family protein n=1 Tax=Herbaspirillum rhizosphaerae TaxID=346179 RepID=UPI00067C597F|nr:nucleotidyltransferase family protein [Herbaspirillum rhizosphaerae]
MRALLLAAGLGTRLRPLTNYLPKCMVPIHGRPLLDYWMEILVGHGIDKVLINTHYMPEPVLRFLESSSWMPWVTLVHEPVLLGTGGTVLKNRDFFEEEAFLVAHADNLTIFDAEDFIRAHSLRPANGEMTMMVFESDDPQSCGIVELDQQGLVHAFHEKVASPPGNLANAAVYIFEPTVLSLLEDQGKPEIDLSTELIPRLIGRINTYKNASYHRDIGSITSWREANRSFPVLPASPQNARAWSEVCEAEGSALCVAVDNLLS